MLLIEMCVFSSMLCFFSTFLSYIYSSGCLPFIYVHLNLCCLVWLSAFIEVLLCRFCRRSLLKETIDESLIDRIPGRQNDRKTFLGELNWIFTAVTDTIAWNVLPRGTSQTFCLMNQDETVNKKLYQGQTLKFDFSFVFLHSS